MQTRFTTAQLADPRVRLGDSILRKCVHCGFCTATCPTYVIRGDELDSPRGRIYLIKGMLESGKPPAPSTVLHIDRCLSCLSCMTTCPSGVDYMHLVDSAREHIEASGVRPRHERLRRWLLGRMVTSRRAFRLGLAAAGLARPFRSLLPRPLRSMVDKAPRRLPGASPADRPQVFAAVGRKAARVALLSGCVQPVLRPSINEATIRLLNRHGVEVVVAAARCCGAATHHMGDSRHGRSLAAATIDAWWRETAEGGGAGLNAVIVNASGCGTTVKDYGSLFADCGDPALTARAEAIGRLALDVSEFVERIGLVPVPASAPGAAAAGRRVAYHSACSLQHGQRVRATPQKLLRQAGFEVRDVPESHLCCGAAGLYTLLQPDLSQQLKVRKAANIASVGPDIVAAGNIGCLIQIAEGLPRTPVVHTVELLDWATGGPKPEGVE